MSPEPMPLNERYGRTVLDHFMDPRNAGELEAPDGFGEVGDPSCGDTVRITIRVEDDRIVDIRFLTYGCPAAIAVASAATELARGRRLDEAAEISDMDVAEALGGLPEHKLHCSSMAVEALKASIRDNMLRSIGEAKRAAGGDA